MRFRIGKRAEVDAFHAAVLDIDELIAEMDAGTSWVLTYKPISIDVPTLDVDTSNGYAPSLESIVDFVRN